jgi:hypothetical protein
MGCLDVVAKGSLDEEFAHEHPEKRRRARDADADP